MREQALRWELVVWLENSDQRTVGDDFKVSKGQLMEASSSLPLGKVRSLCTSLSGRQWNGLVRDELRYDGQVFFKSILLVFNVKND